MPLKLDKLESVRFSDEPDDVAEQRSMLEEPLMFPEPELKKKLTKTIEIVRKFHNFDRNSRKTQIFFTLIIIN